MLGPFATSFSASETAFVTEDLALLIPESPSILRRSWILPALPLSCRRGGESGRGVRRGAESRLLTSGGNSEVSIVAIPCVVTSLESFACDVTVLVEEMEEMSGASIYMAVSSSVFGEVEVLNVVAWNLGMIIFDLNNSSSGSSRLADTVVG